MLETTLRWHNTSSTDVIRAIALTNMLKRVCAYELSQLKHMHNVPGGTRLQPFEVGWGVNIGAFICSRAFKQIL